MNCLHRSPLLPLVLALTVSMVLGCGRHHPPQPKSARQSSSTGAKPSAASLLPTIELPSPSQRLGTAVVILVDTSGSMLQTVRDHSQHQRPKHEIARDALQQIIKTTTDWKAKHTDAPLFVGITSFSSAPREVLPIGPFAAAKASQSVTNIPQPAGGTAVGLAMAAGFQSLYSTGCVRKHLVCITDGDNTVGTPPNLMAQQLYSQTHGDVEMHFVAFDTSARHFGYLRKTGGSVVEAADGSQLQERLTEIYEKRIFAEAMPAEKQ